MSEARNISNKYWLPKKSATKYFYAIILQNTLHCSFIPTKRLCSRSQGFRQIDFLLHFCLISERMRCAIFQINADLVKVYEHINTFTQETLQLSFICEIISKNISLFSPKPIGVLCHRGFWKYPRFTICLLVLIEGELYNISNKNQLPNRSAKYLLFYTKYLTYLVHFQGKLALSIGEAPGNIHFLPLFHWFWEWVRCLILQINTSFLISQQKTYIFTQETLYISPLHISI